MARTNPITFLSQVRQEVSKVVWPTRNETLISTVMVLVMVFVASMFFLLVDWILASGVDVMLNLNPSI